MRLKLAPRTSAAPSDLWLWLGPLIYMLIVGLYFIVRYGGRWAEVDSAIFTEVIRVFAREGRLVPTGGELYPNGYGYQAISAFVLTFTGLDAATLQQLIYPLLAAPITLTAFALFRELTGSRRGALIATMLLFTQPEFLFVILRSSHEKFTRTLLLLCMFWLARSLRLRERPWLFATHVGLFYLTAYTLIASNNLLAHSFIFAIVVALLLGWALGRVSRHLRAAGEDLPRRLAYATLVSLGLVYLFTFYAYQPAQHDLQILHDVWERIAALFLDVETRSSNAYAYVALGWISLPVYFMVSIANWIVLAASFAIWLAQAWRWLWRRAAPPSAAAWLLWLFYAGFAAQGALSAVVDASGSLGGNIQHRLFPSFSILACGLVGAQLAQWRPQRLRGPIRLALSVGIGCVAALSTLKATNEPLLSNKWTFYQTAELEALRWTDAHLHSADIWSEVDERLQMAFLMRVGASANRNLFYGAAEVETATRHLIVTSVSRLRNSRLHNPLPVPSDALRIYDNGDAQLYHVRPRTPYQR
jgi:hypothetical protein